MISEYHVNKLLEKLGEIISNQNKMLEILQSIQKPKSAIEGTSVTPEVSERFRKAMEAVPLTPLFSKTEDKPKETEGEPEEIDRKEMYEFRKYKKAGGKLGLKTWLREGKPQAS